ncbi:VOC family protein [Methylobacterium pseudosasicola]|uniref:Glyoxalase-like domain-containing protein n=1 Tax=Methylobacterium pseudosasicola TaxID=582667 RepID=A0A1I4GQM7_9HYPH|nr:VOC family protein [Methylobacterium pseudosasicola]SFL31783.1 Glyoxalase-like domain-containing protein [Methylobacterium pseudosasicola]
MLTLDHLTVIAPTLSEGVEHVRACLDLDVPFGQRHAYMGTYNHLLQLGDQIYLEIVTVDPDAERPDRTRWFGLDDRLRVKRDWDAGRRLRGWVARTDDIDRVLEGREAIFGRKVGLPIEAPAFHFTIPDDGSLPMDGGVPSIIDRRGKPRAMDAIADRDARLKGFTLEHPEAALIAALLQDLAIDRAPVVTQGAGLRYRAQIETPGGLKELA